MRTVSCTITLTADSGSPPGVATTRPDMLAPSFPPFSTTFGSDAAGRLDATGDRYGVHVLHLTTGSGGPAQDQLYFAGLSDAEPVPDGGMTMTLLGMGLLGLAAGRRYLSGRV